MKKIVSFVFKLQRLSKLHKQLAERPRLKSQKMKISFLSFIFLAKSEVC